MESGEVAYSMDMDSKAQYYLDTGAPSHFIKEIGALHDYNPLRFPGRSHYGQERHHPSVWLRYPKIRTYIT